MSDALTDAVRRLKALREDVERLKAAQNEEGEVRLFFPSEETATASDAVDLRGPEITAAEVATAADAIDLRGPDVVETDAATATDSGRVHGRDVERATWNNSGWNTSTYE